VNQAKRIFELAYVTSVDFAVEQGIANVMLEGMSPSKNLHQLIKDSDAQSSNALFDSQEAHEVILRKLKTV
jgi:hypothetical protein